MFNLDNVKSEPNPANKPRITVCTGPPRTDTSKIDTVASDATIAAIAAPDAFLKLNESSDCDTPLITFSPAPANAAITNRIGMSTMVILIIERHISLAHRGLVLSQGNTRGTLTGNQSSRKRIFITY